MVSISIKKSLLFDLIYARRFDVDSDDLYEASASLLEEESGLTLVRPMHPKLRAELRERYNTLRTTWHRLSTLECQDKFRAELAKLQLKVPLDKDTIVEDSLYAKFTACQQVYDATWLEKYKLEQALKKANSELSKTTSELEKVKTCLVPSEPPAAKPTSRELLGKVLATAPGTSGGRASTPIIAKLLADSESGGGFKKQDIAISNYVSQCLLNQRKEAERERRKINEIVENKIEKIEMIRERKKIGYMTRKNFFELSPRQKSRNHQLIRQYFDEAALLVKNFGLCIASIELHPLEMDECNFKLSILDNQEINAVKRPNVNNLLFYKDKFSIADKCYSDLKSKCHLPIPSLCQLKKRRAELDQLFPIYNNEMGVFLSFKDKLRFRLQKYFERKYGMDVCSDDELVRQGVPFRDHIIHVKLSADGTNIGRNLKLLNFTFTILNEGARAKRASGNYTLGIYEIENEQHASLTECFKELIEEFERTPEIEVVNRTVKIVYYYGADWKMLAIILGLQGANSKYPCVWCKCAKDEFYRTDQEWSIVDPANGARSFDERQAILNYNEKDKKDLVNFGYHKSAVFRALVPNQRYMIDMLHLFLRISDTLFNLLVKDCSLADGFDMYAISRFDLVKYKHMNSLQHFLNEKCNVNFKFVWIAETKKLTWRDLVGPEKIKLFENFSLKEIIPGHEKFDSVVKIWLDFYELLQLVKTIQIDACELKLRTQEWLELYLTVYARTTVTPYMHAFVAHLPEFVHLYKDINAFNCQGLEKLNDMTTGQFFKGTNKHETALHQMLRKRNRMEFLCSYTCEADDKDDFEN